ncbi:hypothetical protein EF900_19795, partial [Staphylococcus aureus]
SQTLKSMYAINDVTSTPILRPLVSLDKEDIVKIHNDIYASHDVTCSGYCIRKSWG